MAALVETPARRLGPIPRRAPFEHTNTWRVLSFLAGVAGPAWIWGWISALEFGPRPEYAAGHSLLHELVWRGSVLFAFAEMLCLALWLLWRPRSPRAQRAFSIVFRLGALFAAGWGLFSIWGFLLLVSVPERAMLWETFIGLVFLSPFVCVFVYSVNARVASELARARRASEEPERAPAGT